MEHFIYKTTCTVTGKFYIGLHSGSITDNYLGSGQVLKASVKKYGRKAHTREILHLCENQNDLHLLEEQIVTRELISDPQCMNIALGGKGARGYSHTDEAKAGFREIAKNRPASHYVKGEKHGFFGKTHTPEVCERIRVAQSKPKGPCSEEHKAKIAASVKARNAKLKELK